MICGHVLRAHPFTFDQVPLSCVPPITSHESDGLIETPTNWRVLLSFLSMCVSSVGTFDSSRMQVCWLLAVRLPARPRSLHCAEMSAKDPLVRITPPSEPSKICVGFEGLIPIACWSGWIPFGARTQSPIPTANRLGHLAKAHHGATVSWL